MQTGRFCQYWYFIEYNDKLITTHHKTKQPKTRSQLKRLWLRLVPVYAGFNCSHQQFLLSPDGHRHVGRIWHHQVHHHPESPLGCRVQWRRYSIGSVFAVKYRAQNSGKLYIFSRVYINTWNFSRWLSFRILVYSRFSWCTKSPPHINSLPQYHSLWPTVLDASRKWICGWCRFSRTLTHSAQLCLSPFL